MALKIFLKKTLLLSLVVFIGILLYSPIAQTQNWIELPPYNTLWPLWSPTLSPVDKATGLPTPVVSSLAFDTVLPVMPGLTWDPSIPYPWMLYNSPAGLLYYDPLSGINPWPVPSFLDKKGLPLPISLPPDFANLPITDPSWIINTLPVANLYYQISTYFPVWPPSATTTIPLLSSLLTPLDILGPTLGVPGAVLPPQIPVPTPILPSLTVPLPTVSLIPPPVPILPIPTGLVPTTPVPIVPLPIAPVPTLVTPTAAISQLVIAEQAGSWSGTWFSLGKFLAGPMTLNIIEDPATGFLSGTAALINNKLILFPVSVSGYITPGATFFELKGTYFNIASGINYSLELWCTLLSSNVMTGNYYLYTLGLGTQSDYGQFNLSLAAPILAPAITAPIVPTVVPTVVPTTLAPILPPPTITAAPIVPTIPAPTISVTPIVPAIPTAAISGLGFFF